MGYPSENLESMYRNKLEDVRRLLEKKHKDHYKIYNLCSERSYDIQKFHCRVAVYPFDDHNPPEFGQMRPFCEDVSKWLEEHEDNVAVVHCKAGKGRTGLMICAYLLHSGVKTTANEVLEYYASIRTQDSKGVTIPSQRRYVDYYATMINSSLQYNPVKMYLRSIVIDPLPQMGRGQQEGYIQFEVRQTSVRPFVSEVYQVRRTDTRINLELPQPILIVGDIKIEFTQKIKLDILNLAQRPRYVNSGKLFHFWVNTFFIDQQSSSSLTHSSNLDAVVGVRCPPQVSTGAGGWSSGLEPEERNCRSTHNSGGTDSPLPPPRYLRHTLSSGDSRTSDPTTHGSSEDQVGPPQNDQNCDIGEAEEGSAVKHSQHISSSDDSIIRPGALVTGGEAHEEISDNGVYTTTHKSFLDKRQRHSSVPQTARTQGTCSQTKSKRKILDGKNMSVMLNKNQIDKAAKDKSGKFTENFKVTLFLVRPNDQTLQAEFSRSNLICQRNYGAGVGNISDDDKHDSTEESSDEEAAVLRSRSRNLTSDSQSDTISQ